MHVLDLLLTRDRILHIPEPLDVHQPIALVFRRERGSLSAAMFSEPRANVVRHACVERLRTVGQDVHPETPLPHLHTTTLRNHEMKTPQVSYENTLHPLPSLVALFPTQDACPS